MSDNRATVTKIYEAPRGKGGGNQVAVEFVLAARVPTGNHYRDEELHLWTFNEHGQVTRLRHYTDTAKHIAAAIPARAARI
ncbi:MAG: hypothetical protein ABI647_24800 [Gemmatimonadota bacterium]